jgi:hypothetical protein
MAFLILLVANALLGHYTTMGSDVLKGRTGYAASGRMTFLAVRHHSLVVGDAFSQRLDGRSRAIRRISSVP